MDVVEHIRMANSHLKYGRIKVAKKFSLECISFLRCKKPSKRRDFYISLAYFCLYKASIKENNAEQAQQDFNFAVSYARTSRNVNLLVKMLS